MPKRAVFKRSRRELSLDVSVGVHILLAVEQSSLESQSRGCAKITILTGSMVFKEIRTHLDLMSIPQSGGKRQNCLGGIIGCKYKISSWYLNGFPDSSNIESTV